MDHFLDPMERTSVVVSGGQKLENRTAPTPWTTVDTPRGRYKREDSTPAAPTTRPLA
jgi:hypothetical protein